MFGTLRKLFFLAVIGSFLLTAIPVSANDPSMGGSRWCFGKNAIVGNIDLKPRLFSLIKGIKDGHYDITSISDDQLRHIAADIIQPYLDKKLSITVNDKKCPVRVTGITRNADNLYTIWLSVSNVGFNNHATQVKIVYSLLFEETNNAHTNLAFGYLADVRGAALQRVFDYYPPAFQTTFTPNAPMWEVSIKGPGNESFEGQKAGRTSER